MIIWIQELKMSDMRIWSEGQGGASIIISLAIIISQPTSQACYFSPWVSEADMHASWACRLDFKSVFQLRPSGKVLWLGAWLRRVVRLIKLINFGAWWQRRLPEPYSHMETACWTSYIVICLDTRRMASKELRPVIWELHVASIIWMLTCTL